VIPVCLTTGFLGCGKTTFLKNIIEQEKGRRIIFLVNEFASIDIDGELVRMGSQDVITIPGGSIFCKCLVGEFIKQLKWIADTFDHTTAGLVIEASGIANPMVIMDMLQETGLDSRFRISRIISIVDPRSILALVHTLPNIKAQISASDMVFLNKTDLFNEEQIKKAEQAITEIKSQVTIVRTSFCDIRIDLFPAHPFPEILHGKYSLCKDPNFNSVSIAVSEPVDVEALKEHLQTFRDEIYRAKGFIITSDGVVYIDFSQTGCTSTKITGNSVTSFVLALVIKGDASGELLEFLNDLGKT
jgi:G3E family GTPase